MPGGSDCGRKAPAGGDTGCPRLCAMRATTPRHLECAPRVYMCVCVPVIVGLCVVWLSRHLKLSPIPVSSRLPYRRKQHPPTPHPRKGGRPRVHPEPHWLRRFVKTLVWLEAPPPPPPPPPREKWHGVVLLESKSRVQVCCPSGLSPSC
ncbi:unnamed protein product [Pleuronectes platessa]|uniref:Uncharacterized protein n=1 Tax=Pleuronectes platessa TaxID=8262 RepID=A0A9N7YJJ8_PLEPL|nr:unnamed protein product [Pleuronectes platessa]